MSKTLVIVESPNKVKKIQGFLGDAFEVRATAGHFRDLPDRELGVDVSTMAPTYVVDEDKKALVSKLKVSAKAADRVLLATDADREGEAISWHLAQVLGLKSPQRIKFQEITAKALLAAVKAPVPLDQRLVDAQQGRRVLDRLVGYQASPLLGVLGSNHSCGRVQTAALRLVVAREQTREAFKKQPYWTITAHYEEGFKARIADVDAEGNLVDRRIPSLQEAQALDARSQGPHVVERIDRVEADRKPKAPFTTSSLQQAASVALGFQPDRTMEVAQELFEGGHITYHRSDSVAVSAEAAAMARDYIRAVRPTALPAAPPIYASKASAQEAHEAIRPTHLELKPPASLMGDALELYKLITARFVASQAKPARVAVTTLKISTGPGPTFRARGEQELDAGFRFFLRTSEDDEEKSDEKPQTFPADLAQGQHLTPAARIAPFKTEVAQHETKPPPRYTQASLIRELERLGIGRPSTFAPTVAVLFSRHYIASEGKTVYPPARGRVVDELLSAAFPELVQSKFTAQLEENLDEVARGKREWKAELLAWHKGWAARLGAAQGVIGQILKAKPELLDQGGAPKKSGRKCPRCEKEELVTKMGSKGPFLACPSRECAFLTDPAAEAHDQPCPTCGKPMDRKVGRFGLYARCVAAGCEGRLDLAVASEVVVCPVCKSPCRDRGSFFGCSRYPECKGTVDKKTLEAGAKSKRKCPKCGAGLVRRTGQKGPFWGCSTYPSCKHTEQDVAKAQPVKVKGGES